jgi:dimeric dUTPase (all-alpha-NTP-PPase superfamily)
MTFNTAIKGTYNFTHEQVAKLCTMQDELNSYIHPEWKLQKFDWNLAIIDECMEIHGHLGWKWWKEGYKTGMTESNKAQIQLEVIDILHFVLSAELSESSSEEYVWRGINGTHQLQWEIEPTIWAVQQEAVSYATYKMETWADLARFVGLTEQMILETYTQKFVLNKFRQDHGYKTGEYVKRWELQFAGYDDAPVVLEDNEVLTHIVGDIKECGHDATSETLLYGQLQYWYDRRLNK